MYVEVKEVLGRMFRHGMKAAGEMDQGKRRGDLGSGGKRALVLFWLLMVFAVCIRLFRFGELPYGVNQDEAMGAVDAWALSLYGTDRFGVSLPVHFSAWQVSQMSVLLSYLMIPFIKIFGFHTWVVRLPMLLASLGGLVLVYFIGRELAGERLALIAMALTVINPWHFMQSRWSIDCNLFPHVFLLAFYLLLRGLKKKKYLYLSMVFFGLTFYCYGIAVYSVTVFLAAVALWGLWKKIFQIKDVILAMVIFGIVALPEALVMLINLLHLKTIQIGPVTMSRFPESVRGNDILFLHFSFGQLGRNIWAMVKSCFLQLPDYWFNTIPLFGPMYHVSIPFMAAGGYLLGRELVQGKGVSQAGQGGQTAQLKAMGQPDMVSQAGLPREAGPVYGTDLNPGKKGDLQGNLQEDLLAVAGKFALWCFFWMGVWVGLITYEVNVNRINIIFYPLIFLAAYALDRLAAWGRRWFAAAGVLFGVCGCLFVGSYFTVYPGKVEQYYNGAFLEAAEELDKNEGSRLYITGNMGWQFNLSMAEILTQYACKIDARYYQGMTHITGGRELAPYPERYHYINVKLYDWENGDREGYYLLHGMDLDAVPWHYDILWENGQFYIIEWSP